MQPGAEIGGHAVDFGHADAPAAHRSGFHGKHPPLPACQGENSGIGVRRAQFHRMDPECHALLCGQGKAVGQAGIIWPQAKQAGDQGFIRAMSLSGGGKTAVQADIRLRRDLAQKLLGRVADPGGTRCMAGRGADHNRPENVKQAHPMHILSCSAGQKSPASHFFLSFIIPLLPHLCYNNFINV